jgi:hypothetical protein
MPFEKLLRPEELKLSNSLEPVLLPALVVVLDDGLIHPIHVFTISNVVAGVGWVSP